MGKSEKGISSPGIIRQYFVEFLGSLVPGIAFTIAIIPAFILPLSITAFKYLKYPAIDIPVFQNIEPPSISTILFLLFPLLIGFFVFAYIAGHLFYRQNPKNVDTKSYIRISKKGNVNDDKKGMARDANQVEFPYHHLQTYLEERGINYLAKRVPWNENNFQRRAKHWANALKLRIQHVSTEGSAILAKNEAHIRLSSSMWYVCNLLFWASMGGLAILTIKGFIKSMFPFECESIKQFDIILLFPLLTAIFSCLTKISIEKALHYQREREILFILEIANWLEITKRAPLMFDGLAPDKKDESQVQKQQGLA